MGYVFTYGDYTCTQVANYQRVALAVTDKTKASYSAIPTSVTYAGYTFVVTTLYECFKDCTNLITAPAIPSSENLTEISWCFAGCTSLTTPPQTIPSTIQYWDHCFEGCTSLTTAPTIQTTAPMYNNFVGCTALTTPPAIPSGVTLMQYTFSDCTSLATPPVIPNSVTSIYACFYNCKSLTTPPVMPSGLTSMSTVFTGCSSLTTAPEIPSGVTNLYQCFSGCTSLTVAPTIPNGVTSMNACFRRTGLTTPPVIPSSVENMTQCFLRSNITTAPEIPSGVTFLGSCFKGCLNLTGNVIINTPATTNVSTAFDETVEPIYIINGGNADADTWKAVASEHTNVHYEADDNPSPTINSFNVTRVASSGSTTPSATGTWAYVEALISIYNTYLPVGWSAGLKSRTLTDNSVVTSPTWQPSPITSYPVTTYCWVDIDDLARHDFTFSIADTITSEGVEKASKTSATITALVTKAYALVDYYHDDNTGTEGMAIGKLAEDADLLDVAVPTFFREDVTVTDANNIIRALFDYMHPVGSYYETSDTSFDPNVTWGGTWQLEAEGQVHISAGANYTVSGALTDTTDGGEATHTLTPSETATKNHSHTINHDHSFTNPTISSNTSGTYILGCPQAISRTTLKNGSGTGYNVYYGSGAITRDGAKATGGAVQQHTGSSGGQTEANGTAHNNMQPYIIVNRWHRTA